MRILHLVNSFIRSGSELFACDLARAQRAHGHDVVVCAVGRVHDGRERGLRTELETAGVRTRSLVEDDRGGLARRMRRLRAALLRDRIEVVHAHVVSPVALAAKLSGAVTVFTFHSEKLRKALRRQTALIEWALARSADAAVAVSRAVEEEATKRTGLEPPRLSVIPNGIDLERFRDWRERRARAAPLRAGRSRPHVLVVARVDRYKGFETVIRAAGVLARQGVGVELRLAGRLDIDPPWVDELRGLARTEGVEDRVRFEGVVDDIPRALAEADVAVSASCTEAFGLAAVEAMASGIPLVASAIPAHLEITDAGRHAVLVPVSDPDALARGIRTVLEGAHGIDVEAARAHVERRYDIHAVANAHEALYASLLGR